ncbi:MAG: hypothetical protein Q9164_006533 [Protoblastenia rupestris]
MSHYRIEGDFILLYDIELEMLLQPKISQLVSFEKLVAEPLSRSLEKHGIHNEILENSKESDYKKWIITKDGSIGRYISENKWGLELISSICMPTQWWFRTCSVVWRAVKTEFDVFESAKCGTHVHVSLYREIGWEGAFGKLRRIAKAVVYFKRCIDSLMPAHRLKNTYCKSNRYNSILRSHTLPAILAMIDEIQEEPDTPEGPDGRKKLLSLLCPSDSSNERNYRWNFTPLRLPDEKKRTIEFRQPPGFTTKFDAAFWCQFTIYFIYGAVLFFDTLDLGETATLSQLRKMILLGESHGASWGYDRQNLERVFEGKPQLAEGPDEEPSPSTEDRARMHAQERVERVIFNRVDAATTLPFNNDFLDEENAWINSATR